ncbi:MAG: caspase family protein, partial [Gammaproteobacteria bacterium]
MNTKKIYSILALFWLLILSQQVMPMPKTALVIGNSAYTVAPLANPANDAKAMGETLRELGFDVDVYVDLELGGMVEAIRKFGNKLKESRGLGLFFYAGHGMQIDGVNYLIPVQNGIEAADEVRYKSINADMVLSKMESAGNNFNIVIMDACRNNPFPKKFRSAEQGLARMDAPTGSIIAYATAPGSTAADGTGSNGLYTSHLLSAMKIPGLSVEEVFKQVRIGVLEESEGRQTPWEASSLTGNFEFVPKSKQRTAQKSQIPPP